MFPGCSDPSPPLSSSSGSAGELANEQGITHAFGWPDAGFVSFVYSTDSTSDTIKTLSNHSHSFSSSQPTSGGLTCPRDSEIKALCVVPQPCQRVEEGSFQSIQVQPSSAVVISHLWKHEQQWLRHELTHSLKNHELVHDVRLLLYFRMRRRDSSCTVSFITFPVAAEK